jgi:hypothetical protein
MVYGASVHALGLLDIPSQFILQPWAHLDFSHSPDCPK